MNSSMQRMSKVDSKGKLTDIRDLFKRKKRPLQAAEANHEN